MQAPQALHEMKEDNYYKGFIYLISDNNNNNMFYVGSTKQKINNRISSHKKDSKKGKSKLYLYIRNNGDITNDFNIKILDEIEYKDIHELREKEKYYINELKPPLNSYKVLNLNVKDRKTYNNLYYYTEKRQDYIKYYNKNKGS
jgi:hypothetical protein